MTLIEIRNNGHLVGRCDGKCYLADPAGIGRRDCVCEGLNHGIGLEAALDNIPRIAQEWRELAGGAYRVKAVAVQLKLFWGQRAEGGRQTTEGGRQTDEKRRFRH